ncbi:MAG: hypothetical protein RL189_261 [Pseudomonadota bacterium]
MWFWRGVFVSAVANSVLAAADLNIQSEPVWSSLTETIEVAALNSTESGFPLTEVELDAADAPVAVSTAQTESQAIVKIDVRTLSGLRLNAETDAVQEVAVQRDIFASAADAKQSGQITFPSDVPRSEVLRVSKTFHGMVQESLRQSVGLLSRDFVGSLASTEPVSEERLAELETTLLDEMDAESGYAIGQDVDSEVETAGFDPFKTYTVVNGRVHAVTPTQVVRSYTAQEAARAVESAPATVIADAVKSSKNPQTLEKTVADRATSENLELPAEQVSDQLKSISPQTSVASIDSNPAQADQVTVRGRVVVPAGYAKDRAVLRMAGTSFEVQTDVSGGFELRDVPRNTRFELLAWHLDGSLTRRLIPVVASGREKSIEINLQKTSDVDQLAASFSSLHQMNLGGFCARVEHENPAALTGGQVMVNAGRKTLQAHYFSANALPTTELSELSEDGRFCVFNIDESVVDVKVALVNGARRQFVVHVEPSTFEHDLTFDMSEAMYRKVSLLEPLDTQQVLELSTQGVSPEFGDKRLRDWLFGSDIPVWTKVSRFLLQSDAAYSAVRPAAEDVQYFPGGQEIIEVRLSADNPGAPLSRVLLSRDQLMSDAMLRQIETLKSRIYQDRSESVSVPALDAEAWDDIVSQHVDVPHLQEQTIGGLYLSLDSLALGQNPEEIVVSVRDTWSGKDVCKVVTLRGSKDIKKTRYFRAVCGASPGQYALVVEDRGGSLLWSDIVRIRAGDVQTVTVLDPKF